MAVETNETIAKQAALATETTMGQRDGAALEEAVGEIKGGGSTTTTTTVITTATTKPPTRGKAVQPYIDFSSFFRMRKR